VQQENAQAADEVALLGASHALDFLGDVLDVGLGEPAAAQQLGPLEAPGKKVAVVKRGLRGHDAKIGVPLGGVYRKGQSFALTPEIDQQVKHSRLW
jgi:hypothetical protein